MTVLRRYKWTAATCVPLAVFIAWAVWQHKWWWLATVGFTAVRAVMDARKNPAPGSEPEWPAWHPTGPSLPCPSACKIRVAHRHDPYPPRTNKERNTRP